MLPRFREILEKRLMRPLEVNRLLWDDPSFGFDWDSCTYIFVDLCYDAIKDFLAYEPIADEMGEFVSILKAMARRLSAYVSVEESQAAIDALMAGKTIHNVFRSEKGKDQPLGVAI